MGLAVDRSFLDLMPTEAHRAPDRPPACGRRQLRRGDRVGPVLVLGHALDDFLGDRRGFFDCGHPRRAMMILFLPDRPAPQSEPVGLPDHGIARAPQLIRDGFRRLTAAVP